MKGLLRKANVAFGSVPLYFQTFQIIYQFFKFGFNILEDDMNIQVCHRLQSFVLLSL